MWKLLRIILVIKVHFIYGKLVGDHICYTEESQLVNVTENYVKNITVRNYQWCYNVPPRCSYYTVKEINDTRIVEKNQTRTIESCCAGFMEKDDNCVRNCPKCEYGECDNGSCICNTGFTGNSCDVAVCNPKTRRCSGKEKDDELVKVVQLSTNETSVAIPTIPTNKLETETIHSRVVSDSGVIIDNGTFSEDVNTADSSLGKLEVSTKYHEVVHTNPTPKSSLKTTRNHDDAHLVADNSSKHINSSLIDIFKDVGETKYLFENSVSSININKNIAGTKEPDTESVLETPLEQFKSSTESTYTKKSQYNVSNEGFLIPVGIKYDQLQNSPSKNVIVPTISYSNSEDYMLVPKEGFTKENDPSDAQVSINSLTIVVISMFIVIVLVVAIMIVSYTRRSKSKESLKKDGVSFIATSIFHKPLPDPPTTENPMYLTPVGHQRGITEAPTFETTIFCNFNAPNRPISDYREYLYDHPPSTGSYRAASSIEPVDMNRSSISEEAEPLYDEIRYREDTDHTYDGAYQYSKPMSIYINTFGKTKF